MVIMNGVFAVAAGALAIPPLVSRALGGRPPNPAPKLAALAPAATVPAVAAVALAATYAWWLAFVLAVPAAVLTVWQLPPRRPRSPDSGPAALCVRLLTLNAQSGNAEADVLVERVRDHVVDVLAVQELTPGLACRLVAAGLCEVLPFSEVHARAGYAGIGIWSRWPLQPLPPVHGLVSAAPCAALTVAGQSVTVTAVHVLAPMHGREHGWQRELGLLRSGVAGVAGPQLVAGDFNASRDHRPFRQLLEAGFHDCADAARRRRWPAFTWPSARPRLPVMRLDHVLATRVDFVVLACRTLRVPDTDHRGVLAVVQLVNLPLSERERSYCDVVPAGPRLRQVALVARDCRQVADELRQAFGWPPPFHDPGVGQFGLTNAVFAVGDTFVEVVAPMRPDTAAGRYLERRGGDGGYMAIFQVPDIEQARARVADLGVRVVWRTDMTDMAGTHLHPKDVPGAIVSLDWAEPATSWRWAGPSWTGQTPAHGPGGLAGLTIEVTDPHAAASRWAAVLGLAAAADGDGDGDQGGALVDLPDHGQWLRFVPARAGHGEGITAVTIAKLPGSAPARIGGVTFLPAEN